MLKFSLSPTEAHKIRADAVAVFCPEGAARLASLPAGDLRRSLLKVMRLEQFSGKEGETLLWHSPDKASAPRYLVIGTGDKKECDLDTVRRLFAGVARRLDGKARHLAAVLPGDGLPTPGRVQAAVEGAALGSYHWDPYFTSKEKQKSPRLDRITLLTSKNAANKAALEQGRVYSLATNLAKELVCEAPSTMTPKEMEKRARKIARQSKLKLTVYDEKQAAKMGMGCFLGVARGSNEPPRVLHLVYRPPGKARRRPRLALVGKGITFDSGGLSLKPASSMEIMKSDMAGAASVLAIMSVLPALKCKAEVHGILMMTENMPSGTAYKPGDILRSMSGKTVEVLNTDAEGRLALADGLEFAKRLAPDRIIDLATLTGACVVALGTLCSGVMGFHQDMVDEILKAGRASGEKLWPLPLFKEYRAHLNSKVADIKHVGNRWGGAITAGLFLGDFVGKDIPWVHMDIAGPAFAEEDQPLSRVGGTGHPVRTLLHYIHTLR